MSNKGPGRHDRKGITLIEAVEYFGDDTQAEAWFVERRWPDGIRCAYCDSDAITSRKTNRQTPQYHCTSCKENFTVKTGTIMHDSKLSLSKWALAFYLFSTNLKGVSSMKLHRDLGITQKSAWHLAHRIRETWDDATERFAGPVEADESYFGGKEPNKHKAKKLNSGRGSVGKTAVAGVKDRATNQIVAQVVPTPTKAVLHDFIEQTVEDNATVYTDEWGGYHNLPRKHHIVRHSVGQYVDGMASTNGIESFWAMMKRGFTGTYHQMSPKHLDRYVQEFEGRHNARPMDTADQMAAMVRGSDGKRLQYQELIA